MNRPSVRKPVVICVRVSVEAKKRFDELTTLWNLTYGDTFEMLVKQAEHRREKRESNSAKV